MSDQTGLISTAPLPFRESVSAAPAVPYIDMLGQRLHPIDLPQAVAVVEALLHVPGQHVIMTANVDHVVKLAADKTFALAYADARLRLLDGAPIAALARRLVRDDPAAPTPARAAGADLMPYLLQIAAARHLRVVFVGGSPATITAARARLAQDHPGIVEATFLCPPQGFQDDAVETRRLQEEIASRRADIVFCCLGAPKQENWWYLHGPSGPRVVLHCGAALDFWAGTVRRAPALLRRAGFEWVWRLLMEPRRMWRRYLVDDRRFVAVALRELRSEPTQSRHGTEALAPTVIVLP